MNCPVSTMATTTSLPRGVPIGDLLQDDRFDAQVLRGRVPDSILNDILKWLPGDPPLPFADRTVEELEFMGEEVLVDVHE